MSDSGGQLCARARFWASLRIDGELSELEGALLDAHVARCPDCAAFVAGAATSTAALRALPLASHASVVVVRPASPKRVFAGVVAAAAVISIALLGGLADGSRSGQSGSVVAARSVAVVATAETPDQLRRLRRTTLLNARPLPREISNEPA